MVTIVSLLNWYLLLPAIILAAISVGNILPFYHFSKIFTILPFSARWAFGKSTSSLPWIFADMSRCVILHYPLHLTLKLSLLSVHYSSYAYLRTPRLYLSRFGNYSLFRRHRPLSSPFLWFSQWPHLYLVSLSQHFSSIGNDHRNL